MWVLTRKINEGLAIGDNIRITVTAVDKDTVERVLR
jgi:carbon storage regulator CsrA